jgi:hypothetical protein
MRQRQFKWLKLTEVKRSTVWTSPCSGKLVAGSVEQAESERGGEYEDVGNDGLAMSECVATSASVMNVFVEGGEVEENRWRGRRRCVWRRLCLLVHCLRLKLAGTF